LIVPPRGQRGGAAEQQGSDERDAGQKSARQ